MNDYQQILEDIRKIAGDGQPTTDLSQLLYDHNCFYLLSKIKSTSAYTAKYKVEAAFNQICAFQRYQACRDVFCTLEAVSIPYAIVKGIVLSQAFYGKPYSRKSGDIDLLIRRKDIDEVKRIILDCGFVQGYVTTNGIEPFPRCELLFQTAMSHQTAPFIKKTDNPLCPYINMDINMDIFWGESGRQTDIDFVLAHTETADVCGTTVQKLPCEMEFIALCLHHYKDMNSLYLLLQGSLKLSLLCDIYFYVKSCRPDIHKLKTQCQALRVCDYVYYCLYYAHWIFDDDLLLPYLSAMKTKQSERLLNTFGLAQYEIQEWDIPFPDRLFKREDIPVYFKRRLSPKDWEKIRINMEYM